MGFWIFRVPKTDSSYCYFIACICTRVASTVTRWNKSSTILINSCPKLTKFYFTKIAQMLPNNLGYK